jgi:hypothetical protein
MAKKLNSADYLLFGTVAVGGIGYYLYSKGKLPFVDKLLDNIKGKSANEKVIDTPPTPTANTTPVVEKKVVAKPPVDPFKAPAYIDKVKRLQVYLGVGVDGNAGTKETSQTNQALKKKFPTAFAKNGILRPTNVDAYIKEIDSAQARVTEQSSNDQRKKFGQKLVDLYYKQKSKIVRSSVSSPVYKTFDKARNNYVDVTSKATTTIRANE